MLKLLGALLIISIGGFAAVTSVRYERRRVSVIDGWIDLIFYIRGQIDCYLLPIGEILEKGDSYLNTAKLSYEGAANLNAILEASSIYLDGDVKRLLEGFVSEIGDCYREEQVRRCEYYMNALSAQRDKIAANAPIRIKLSATLCMCIALGTSILLW